MWLCLFSCRQFEDTFEKAQWRKVKQMQPMRLCLFSGKRFEETFKNAQWRKVEQMQPMRLCILSSRSFEDTFEDTQRRQAKQMQPMSLRILSGRQFEETFENTQWREVEQMFLTYHLRPDKDDNKDPDKIPNHHLRFCMLGFIAHTSSDAYRRIWIPHHRGVRFKEGCNPN